MTRNLLNGYVATAMELNTPTNIVQQSMKTRPKSVTVDGSGQRACVHDGESVYEVLLA